MIYNAAEGSVTRFRRRILIGISRGVTKTLALMALRVRVKLYGVFRSTAGTENLSVEVSDANPTVRSAISELVSRPGCGELQKLIFEEGSSDPRSNALILLAGREIGALAGLDTKLKEEDELSLLPVAHGG